MYLSEATKASTELTPDGHKLCTLASVDNENPIEVNGKPVALQTEDLWKVKEHENQVTQRVVGIYERLKQEIFIHVAACFAASDELYVDDYIERVQQQTEQIENALDVEVVDLVYDIAYFH